MISSARSSTRSRCWISDAAAVCAALFDDRVAILELPLDVDDGAELPVELVRQLLRIEHLAVGRRRGGVGAIGIDRAVLVLGDAGEEAVDDLRARAA